MPGLSDGQLALYIMHVFVLWFEYWMLLKSDRENNPSSYADCRLMVRWKDAPTGNRTRNACLGSRYLAIRLWALVHITLVTYCKNNRIASYRDCMPVDNICPLGLETRNEAMRSFMWRWFLGKLSNIFRNSFPEGVTKWQKCMCEFHGHVCGFIIMSLHLYPP